MRNRARETDAILAVFKDEGRVLTFSEVKKRLSRRSSLNLAQHHHRSASHIFSSNGNGAEAPDPPPRRRRRRKKKPSTPVLPTAVTAEVLSDAGALLAFADENGWSTDDLIHTAEVMADPSGFTLQAVHYQDAATLAGFLEENPGWSLDDITPTAEFLAALQKLAANG